MTRLLRSILKVLDQLIWGSVARLYLHSDQKPIARIVLFQGPLAEAVSLAVSRPEQERPRLFISCELFEKELTWVEIDAIFKEPNFPILM